MEKWQWQRNAKLGLYGKGRRLYTNAKVNGKTYKDKNIKQQRKDILNNYKKDIINNYNYAVIMTVKNEYPHIKKVLECLINQSMKPGQVIVYDDDSTDYTYEVLNEMKREFELRNIKFEIHIDYSYKKHPNYFHRLANNLNKIEKKIDPKYKYLMKLDGDVLLPVHYVFNLFEEFNLDPGLGSISGNIQSIDYQTMSFIPNPKRYNHYPLGAAMIFKRNILDYHEGYPVYPASDTVINLTSEFLYRKVKMSFAPEVTFYQVRATSSRQKGSISYSTAIKHYYLNYPHILTYAYLLKSSPFSVFKYTKFLLFNQPKDKSQILSDPGLNKYNLTRLKKHKLARYILWLVNK